MVENDRREEAEEIAKGGPNEGGGAWTTENEGRAPSSKEPAGTYRGMAGSQAHGVVPAAESNVSEGMSSGARHYTVEDGDTLETIAARFYGSAAEWERIAEANQDKLGLNNLLYPGQELTVPEVRG
ncbi:MAG: LysM peptidoglycan-binding domain-containing protein [Dehalococcoidia bacterium]|nr:LysM peptidoglycan-binding domain-containing protein [Dehalococcoidia bacterium]